MLRRWEGQQGDKSVVDIGRRAGRRSWGMPGNGGWLRLTRPKKAEKALGWCLWLLGCSGTQVLEPWIG